jgi:predicted TIM-barrel fold metal-dependent hydrolase
MSSTPGTPASYPPPDRPSFPELPPITPKSDTRDILAHAAQDTQREPPRFIVDVDAHVTETAFWTDIVDRIDNDVMRQMAQSFREKHGSPPGLLNHQPGMTYQDAFGRIPHQVGIMETTDPDGPHRLVQLARRAMDSMGIHYQVVFPTPMLLLGMHPQPEVEVALGRAFNSWMAEVVLPQESRIKGLVYLPFNDPEASLRVAREFADAPGVIGFSVTATRNRPVQDNAYMKLYAFLEEIGKPLAFHAGFHWGDHSILQLNRFISMHAITFVHYNLIHLTNWVINGLPERFPKLKLIWVESGLAWVPFIMQRLDHEFLMRPSEAPLLKRMPSEYIAEMFFTSQPLERTNMALTESTFKAINANSQLLFSSDWPHWDFDLPSSITTLPFLDESAKRNILGLNAARLFNLPVPKQYTSNTFSTFKSERASA